MNRTCCILALLCCFMAGNPAAVSSSPRLEGVASESTLFTGQHARLTYSLVFNGPAPRILSESGPDLPGLWLAGEERAHNTPGIPIRKGMTDERKAVITTLDVVAIEHGQVMVGNYQLKCILAQQDAGVPDTLLLTAPDIVLNVNPLPLPVPTGFSGAVGQCRISMSVVNDTLRAGTPFIVETIITGSETPYTDVTDLHTIPEELRIISRSVDMGRNSIRKRLSVVAENEGSVTIPEAELVYFDPEEQRYRTASSRPLSITVMPALPEEHIPAATDNSVSGSNGNSSRTFLVFAVMAIAAAAAVAFRKLVAARTASPTGHSARQASPAALRGAIHQALATACGPHTESLHYRQLEEEMERQGIDAGMRCRIVKLLETLDREDFAPQSLHETDHSLAEQSELLIGELRSRYSRPSRSGPPFSARP
ncbi:BatD family protein [Prosthecochloris sp. HL-130-GSB]|uniref:BatD family protein n=1 Tax=Prosthecochloris sp. HL-130-GSB TaxID=1974213 RepID=UPI000A1C0B8C|nr:BatD family protein [Prosthecochloris sp. HL-130-GSB]ARM31642.1 hypothetical protein B9H02_10460 [Prosthecochloris sp. HL-130-GSB]